MSRARPLTSLMIHSVARNSPEMIASKPYTELKRISRALSLPGALDDVTVQ